MGGFGGHFWIILEVKNAQKSDAFFYGFVSGVFVVLGWVLGPILRIVYSFPGTFCDNGENSIKSHGV